MDVVVVPGMSEPTKLAESASGIPGHIKSTVFYPSSSAPSSTQPGHPLWVGAVIRHTILYHVNDLTLWSWCLRGYSIRLIRIRVHSETGFRFCEKLTDLKLI